MLLRAKLVEVVAPSVETVISLSQALADPCSFFHWEQDVAAILECTKRQKKGVSMPKKGSKSKKAVDDVPDQQEKKLPDYLELQRTRVVCNADAPIHVYIHMLLSFHVFAFIA